MSVERYLRDAADGPVDPSADARFLDDLRARHLLGEHLAFLGDVPAPHDDVADVPPHNGTGRGIRGSKAGAGREGTKSGTGTGNPNLRTGTVKWFNAEKGYGFISVDDGKGGSGPDLFVHVSAIELAGERMPREGDRVVFEIVQGPRGPEVTQATIVS